MTLNPAQGELTSSPAEDGATRLDLLIEGRSVSHVFIIPLTMSIGVARVGVDGIGGVWTEEDCRNRGHARRVLDEAVRRMWGGQAALSMLFGIPDFYEKVGYTTAGPGISVHLTELSHVTEPPRGWTVRPCTPTDLPAIHRLYERGTASAVGAIVREPEGRVWSALRKVAEEASGDECRVVGDPNGVVSGYVWRGRDFWPVDTEEEAPDALAIGEVVADGPAAADALVGACVAWANEESGRRPRVTRAQLSLPPEGPVYAALARRGCKLEVQWSRSGEFMARTLSVGRLLAALEPELSARARAAKVPSEGRLRIVTDLGEAVLDVTPHGVSLQHDGGSATTPGPMEMTVELTQQDLTRLALGTFSPGDVLDRLTSPPGAVTRGWMEVLFPQRHPYSHLPDWI